MSISDQLGCQGCRFWTPLDTARQSNNKSKPMKTRNWKHIVTCNATKGIWQNYAELYIILKVNEPTCWIILVLSIMKRTRNILLRIVFMVLVGLSATSGIWQTPQTFCQDLAVLTLSFAECLEKTQGPSLKTWEPLQFLFERFEGGNYGSRCWRAEGCQEKMVGTYCC